MDNIYKNMLQPLDAEEKAEFGRNLKALVEQMAENGAKETKEVKTTTKKPSKNAKKAAKKARDREALINKALKD